MKKTTAVKTTKKTKKLKFDKTKPVLLIKLGDKKKGWIPGVDSQRALAEMCRDMGLTDKFNIMIYHYGIEVALVDADNKKLEEYGLKIVDEKKFDKLVTQYTKISTNNTPKSIKELYKSVDKKK